MESGEIGGEKGACRKKRGIHQKSSLALGSSRLGHVGLKGNQRCNKDRDTVARRSRNSDGSGFRRRVDLTKRNKKRPERGGEGLRSRNRKKTVVNGLDLGRKKIRNHFKKSETFPAKCKLGRVKGYDYPASLQETTTIKKEGQKRGAQGTFPKIASQVLGR